MDALSDVLRVAQLTGGVFLHAEFFAPWCITARLSPEHCAPVLGPASDLIIYHYVVEGDVRIRVDGVYGEDVRLGAGDVALLPRNDLHLMGGDLSLPPVAGGDVIRLQKTADFFRPPWRKRRTDAMICGFLGCGRRRADPVISTLPPVHVQRRARRGRGMDPLDAAIWSSRGRRWSARISDHARKASEVLFLEAVQRYAETLPDGQTGWLAGLREPYVGRALALLHGDITRSWTVDDLGREVGLSRSALADRFIRLIGVPPMHYLANWRMQVATQKLRNTSASLAQVAETVGYDSEAAFSRAFKKAFGAAPATWRRSNS